MLGGDGHTCRLVLRDRALGGRLDEQIAPVLRGRDAGLGFEIKVDLIAGFLGVADHFAHISVNFGLAGHDLFV